MCMRVHVSSAAAKPQWYEDHRIKKKKSHPGVNKERKDQAENLGSARFRDA